MGVYPPSGGVRTRAYRAWRRPDREARACPYIQHSCGCSRGAAGLRRDTTLASAPSHRSPPQRLTRSALCREASRMRRAAAPAAPSLARTCLCRPGRRGERSCRAREAQRRGAARGAGMGTAAAGGAARERREAQRGHGWRGGAKRKARARVSVCCARAVAPLPVRTTLPLAGGTYAHRRRCARRLPPQGRGRTQAQGRRAQDLFACAPRQTGYLPRFCVRGGGVTRSLGGSGRWRSWGRGPPGATVVPAAAPPRGPRRGTL